MTFRIFPLAQRHSRTIEVLADAMQEIVCDGENSSHPTLPPGAMSSCGVVAAAPAQLTNTPFTALPGTCTRTKNEAAPALSSHGLAEIPELDAGGFVSQRSIIFSIVRTIGPSGAASRKVRNSFPLSVERLLQRRP
jgi:hypothetical protein